MKSKIYYCTALAAVSLFFVETATAQTTSGFKTPTKVESSNSGSASTPQTSTPAKVDEAKIVRKYFTLSEVPADFPKYVEGTSIEVYRADVKAWAKAHPDVVREEYRARLNDEKATLDGGR